MKTRLAFRIRLRQFLDDSGVTGQFTDPQMNSALEFAQAEIARWTGKTRTSSTAIVVEREALVDPSCYHVEMITNP